MAKALVSYPTTCVTLIDRLRQGDNRDWQQFFDLYAPILLRIASFSGLTHAESEDLVSQVRRAMLRAARTGFRVDHQKGRFRTYLRSVANHETRRLYRARKPAERVGTPLDQLPDSRSDLGEQIWADVERQEILRTSLQLVRESKRVSAQNIEVFDRYVFNSESPQQIANSLGIQVNRLYGIIHEVKKRIRIECIRLGVEMGD